MVSHYKIRQFVIVVNLVFFLMSITLFGFNVDRSLAAHRIEGWSWGKARGVAKDIEGKFQETVGNIIANRLMTSKDVQVEGKVLN
ncbi:MAG: hypothetical protein NT070_15435 [Cyanobacteria bacterium]|nr:hypothetical protein [Cyanobacteriota bacterium]